MRVACTTNTHYQPDPDKWYCLKCPEGNTCSSTAINAGSCPSGQWESGNLCYNCPAGKFCPDPRWGQFDCPIGYYNDNTNQIECFACPAGQSCLNTANTPSNCPNGQYSLLGDHECNNCTITLIPCYRSRGLQVRRQRNIPHQVC